MQRNLIYMQKRGISVIITTVILILLASILAGVFFKWIAPYARGSTDDIDERKEELDVFGQIKVSIKSVEVNSVGLDITIENEGELTVVGFTVRTTIPEGATDELGKEVPAGVYSRNYPFDGSDFELEFFGVETITVWYVEISTTTGFGDGTLRDYEKVEIIPIIRLEDGSEEQFGEELDSWP